MFNSLVCHLGLLSYLIRLYFYFCCCCFLFLVPASICLEGVQLVFHSIFQDTLSTWALFFKLVCFQLLIREVQDVSVKLQSQ